VLSCLLKAATTTPGDSRSTAATRFGEPVHRGLGLGAGVAKSGEATMELPYLDWLQVFHFGSPIRFPDRPTGRSGYDFQKNLQNRDI
jgi:hypothetical protein